MSYNMKLSKLGKNKKGAGVVSGLVIGIGALIFSVVVGYVLIDTLLGANLLKQSGDGEGKDEGKLYNVSQDLATNITSGVTEIGNKIPTILLISAVVLLFGVLAILVLQARRMGMFGGGGGI